MDSWGLNCEAGHLCPPHLLWESDTPSFCPQHTVTLVPVEEFSTEFVEPRVFCVSSHGTFNPSR